MKRLLQAVLQKNEEVMIVAQANEEELDYNKKILLRERKRHTSPPRSRSKCLLFQGGGYPEMGYPPQRWDPPVQGWGTPPSKVGVPPSPQRWVPPPSKVRVPPLSKAGLGTPPPLHPRLDQEPPRPRLDRVSPPEQTHTCENITSRRTYVRGR